MSKLARIEKHRNTAQLVKSGEALVSDQTYITPRGKGFVIVSNGFLKRVHQKGVGVGESPQRAVIDSRVKVFVRGDTIYAGNYGKKSKKVGTLVETPRWKWVTHEKIKKTTLKHGGKK